MSPTPDRFLSFAEVAEMLGLKVSTVRDGKRETNKLLRIKLGGRVVFSLNNVQEWMKWQARKAEEEKRRQEIMAEYRATEKETEKKRRQMAVERTLQTIINGGRYR
jgi:predicted DNA-binding transcriptional regulator AlpA